MDYPMLMLVIGLGAALVGGYFVARQSEEFEAVRGGGAAKGFHFLASAGMSGIPAALIVALFVTIFTSHNLLDDFVKYVVGTLVVVVVSLLLYGALEPDPQVEADVLPPLD